MGHCHSNLTKWPWYSNVAPMSWLVQSDVEEGRRAVNLSTGNADLTELVDAIREGSMPPWQYKLAHPAARLSDREKVDLIHGIQATFVPGGADRRWFARELCLDRPFRRLELALDYFRPEISISRRRCRRTRQRVCRCHRPPPCRHLLSAPAAEGRGCCD
jgi:hypothetical protein